jgi:hypothetical protein
MKKKVNNEMMKHFFIITWFTLLERGCVRSTQPRANDHVSFIYVCKSILPYYWKISAMTWGVGVDQNLNQRWFEKVEWILLLWWFNYFLPPNEVLIDRIDELQSALMWSKWICCQLRQHAHAFDGNVFYCKYHPLPKWSYLVYLRKGVRLYRGIVRRMTR